MAVKKSKKNTPKKNPNLNYWAISTIILAILLIIVLAVNYSGSTTGAFASISNEEVGQKVVDFAKGQGAEAELISVEKEDQFYKVTLNIQNQDVPLYVTSDGKNIVPSLIPLETEEQTTSPQTQSSNVPKSTEPKVELFVMSHCPYGTQSEKGIIPVVNLLGNKIDFELKFVFYSMHPSAGEVEEQLNQYCIQKEQKGKFIEYLSCFLQEGDGESCLIETGIDMKKLEACTNVADTTYEITKNLEDKSSWLSGQFPLFNIHKEDNEKYGIRGSPALVINGVQVQAGRDSASILATICEAFEEAPEECSIELSSETPGPGFGFDTTTANPTAAECGA